MRLILAFGVVFFLASCAAVSEWENTRLNPRIDALVDATYARMCNLRFHTEQRFLARQQISPMTQMVYCKRMVPASDLGISFPVRTDGS